MFSENLCEFYISFENFTQEWFRNLTGINKYLKACVHEICTFKYKQNKFQPSSIELKHQNTKTFHNKLVILNINISYV